MGNVYQVDSDSFSASTDGRPVKITSSTSTAADVVHLISDADALDSVWLTLRNRSTGTSTVYVVLNPNDAAVSGDVDSAAFPVELPARSSVMVLEGERFRANNTTYTVGVYLNDAADSGKVLATGWVVRTNRGQITY